MSENGTRFVWYAEIGVPKLVGGADTFTRFYKCRLRLSKSSKARLPRKQTASRL